MIFFDIPYSPVQGAWSVDVSNGGHPEFKSRHDALRFAVNSALSAGQWGEAALITVEGVDGLWRMFDHQAKGVA
ncbi:hypothetical protein [Dyella sp. S184]|jgi:hypothetical protein|uniref:hypothetical protein n=1 Tax=Dyella sp. S184 TaxID=1641862 RepID=UPI00131C00B7|nr:hypothetical protein [Dyella sp. S184]